MNYTDFSSQPTLTKIAIRILVPFSLTRKKTKARQKQARNIIQNAELPINQLPVELLIKIISFAGHPSLQTPYPYVPFSSVCHYWRSIILDNAVFWNTIVLDCRSIYPPFLGELIRRSRNAPLEIIVKDVKPSDVYTLIIHQFPSVTSRVKTLYLNVQSESFSYYPLSDLISFFPSLENIFFHFPLPADLDRLPSSVQPQLKAMRIFIENEHLGNLAAPGHFRELCWLSLTYEMNSISLLSLLEALQNLPNLQFLRLFTSSREGLGTGTQNNLPIITLHKLTVLFSNCQILHFIDAPKLSYLDASVEYPSHSPIKDTYGHLCGFNFSTITHIRSDCEMIHGSSYPYITENSTYLFEDFPISDYPTQFRLSFGSEWSLSSKQPSALIPTFALYIEKATNLVEIVLDEFDVSSFNHPELDFLSETLRNATSVSKLTILSGNGFKNLCDFFLTGSNGDLVPHLERITYIADYREEDEIPSYIPESLRKLKERHARRGLEIALKGFGRIRHRELEQIEKLGSLRMERTWGHRFNFHISFVG